MTTDMLRGSVTFTSRQKMPTGWIDFVRCAIQARDGDKGKWLQDAPRSAAACH